MLKNIKQHYETHQWHILKKLPKSCVSSSSLPWPKIITSLVQVSNYFTFKKKKKKILQYTTWTKRWAFRPFFMQSTFCIKNTKNKCRCCCCCCSLPLFLFQANSSMNSPYRLFFIRQNIKRNFLGNFFFDKIKNLKVQLNSMISIAGMCKQLI